MTPRYRQSLPWTEHVHRFKFQANRGPKEGLDPSAGDHIVAAESHGEARERALETLGELVASDQHISRPFLWGSWSEKIGD